MTASIRMQHIALIIIFALQPGYAMDCMFLLHYRATSPATSADRVTHAFSIATYKVE